MTTVTDITDRRIGKNIETLLSTSMTEQGRLAAAIGMETSKMSKALSGHRRWKSDELEAIADFFDVPIDRLFHGPKIEDLERLLGDRVSRCTALSLVAA